MNREKYIMYIDMVRADLNDTQLAQGDFAEMAMNYPRLNPFNKNGEQKLVQAAIIRGTSNSQNNNSRKPDPTSLFSYNNNPFEHTWPNGLSKEQSQSTQIPTTSKDPFSPSNDETAWGAKTEDGAPDKKPEGFLRRWHLKAISYMAVVIIGLQASIWCYSVVIQVKPGLETPYITVPSCMFLELPVPIIHADNLYQRLNCKRRQQNPHNNFNTNPEGPYGRFSQKQNYPVDV